MSLTLAIIGLACWLIHVDNLVLGMAETETDIVTEVLADGIGVMEFQLKTLVVCLTQVAGSHCGTYPLRTALVRGQDIVALLIEVVEATEEQTIQETEIDTGIILMGLLPSYIIVRILTLIDSGNALGTKAIGIGILHPLLLIEEALAYTVHQVLVVTDLTIAGTNLQVVEPLLCRLHKLLVGESPTERESWEETKTLALTEVLRTIVTEVDLCQVAIIIAVGSTTYKTLVTTSQLSLIAVVVLVVEQHTCHIMLAKLASIVQLTLDVELVSGGLVITSVNQLSIRVVLIIRIYNIEVACATIQLVGSKACSKLAIVISIVVEADHRTCRKTWSQPIHLVIGDEVGLIDGVGGTIETCLSQTSHRVVLVLRRTCIEVAYSTIIISQPIRNWEQPSWCMVQVVECLRVRAIESLIAVRTLALLETSTEVDRHGQVLGQEEVQVGTETDTVVTLVRLVAILVLTEVLEQTLLVVVLSRYEVAHTLSTTLDIDVVTLSWCRIAEHGIIPIYIRIEESVIA